MPAEDSPLAGEGDARSAVSAEPISPPPSRSSKPPNKSRQPASGKPRAKKRRQPASRAVESKKKRLSTPKPFPIVTLEKSLSVALAVKDKNAGNPWPPTEVAKALGIAERSSSIDNFYRSSALYGLTTGTRNAAYISLEKIGREIVYAPNSEQELYAKRQAFLNVELFSKVLEYYKGNNLPDLQFLSNTLVHEFGVPVEFHEDFRDIFQQNCKFVEIGSNWQGLTTPGNSVVRSRAESPSVVSYASEVNVDGRNCFVIMPFSERLSNRSKGFFDEVFESLIKPAAEAAGFDVQTANKDGSDVIQSTIINELMDAELVIADLTDHNPNVLFELGFRMAQEKPVAIIKTNDTGGIFDVDNMLRVFEYNENLWTSSIKTDVPRLEGHIRATWDNRETNRTYISILRSKT
jgi:hypothetical protein